MTARWMAPASRWVVAGSAMLASYPRLPRYPVTWRSVLVSCPKLPRYPVTWHSMLAGHPWLAQAPWLTGHPRLREHPVLVCTLTQVRPLLIARMLPDPDALADPDRAGPEYAPELSRARHVEALAGAQREVLMITGQVAGTVTGAAGLLDCPCWVLARDARNEMGAAVDRTREPVVRVGPGGRLLRIFARRADPLRKFGQLVPATLANCSERYRVPSQIQRDLVRLADPIAATYSLNGQHGTINATQRPHNGTLTSR